MPRHPTIVQAAVSGSRPRAGGWGTPLARMRDLVAAVAGAAAAAGADGLLVEVHEHPEEALSDGAQSLRPERFVDLVAQLRRVAAAVHRTL